MPTIVGDHLVEKLLTWWAHRPNPQRSWDSWDAPHRESIPQAVFGVYGKAVYEIGCSAGPNLRLIREHCPEVRIGGFDINASDAAWASEHLGIHVPVLGIPQDVGPEWDVTLSCYTLAYCLPDVVAQQLERIESEYLILLEPWGWGKCLQTSPAAPPHWYHDWRLLCGDTGWQLEWRWPLPERNELNSLTIFQKRRG